MMAGRFPPRVAIGAIVLVLALPIIYFGSQIKLGPGPDASTVVVGRDPLMDAPAPQISLTTVDGQTVALSDYRGRPVIVNFWASWCVPCRDEFPLLAASRTKYAAQGLEILGVIYHDSAQNAAAFAATYHAEWPLLTDPTDMAWTAYHGAFVPVTYFIDRQGIVRAVSYGAPPEDNFDAVIAKIL